MSTPTTTMLGSASTGRLAEENRGDLELQLPHGVPERQRDGERGRLGGQHRPYGVLAATVSAVEGPRHLAPTVRGVHQRLNR